MDSQDVSIAEASSSDVTKLKEVNDFSINFDKRTQRRMDCKDYTLAIEKFRSNISTVKAFKTSSTLSSNSKICVVVRKRPLFEHELAKDEFDVVTAGPGAMHISLCTQRMEVRNGVRKMLDNFTYPCEMSYGEESSNEKVYSDVGRPVLQKAIQGGTGTIFMFGQTGSGKTYTMGSIQQSVAQDIFELAAGQPISLTYFELQGKTCVDLLSVTDDGRRVELKLLTDADGVIHPIGAKRINLHAADELVAAMSMAVDRRETRATGINASSSRSHAICNIFIGATGKLTLVDLAGSERKEDSAHHDAQQRKESADINTSLMALKDCIRQRAMAAKSTDHVHIPYRNSNLTKVLKSSLDDSDASTVVIATVSPGSADTEHSMSTLDTVCMITGQGGGTCKTEEVHDWAPEKAPTQPSHWSPEELKHWITTTDNGKYSGAVVPSSMDGKSFLKASLPRCKLMCEHIQTENKSECGTELFYAFRAELKRVQEMEKQRRAEIVDVKGAKKKVISTYTKVLAPPNPTSAEAK